MIAWQRYSSGNPPFMNTLSFTQIFGTTETLYLRRSSGNSKVPTTRAETRGLAAANEKASRTDSGQTFHEGVTKTAISTSSSRLSRKDLVSSVSSTSTPEAARRASRNGAVSFIVG